MVTIVIVTRAEVFVGCRSESAVAECRAEKQAAD